jgi:FkbM family methyltransferase
VSRLDKLSRALLSGRLAGALLRQRVLVGAEHRHVIRPDLATIVDIGANRGQFALAAREWSPHARVISFEPLPGPARVFRSIFSGDDRVVLHEVAIGPNPERREMHVSARDDSSSLLPISDLQSKVFPGTAEISTLDVQVAPLETFVAPHEIKAPAMLKLDVQGFEYEALIGCESMLPHFDLIYCECSFIELYSGQRLAGEIVEWLSARSFMLKGICNVAYDRDGASIQADFLFSRKS